MRAAPGPGPGASTAPLGRGPELEAIDAFLAGLARGPSGLGLLGPPGIGKSVLWTTAVARAPAPATVLVARPTEPERDLAYAGLADLLRPVAGAGAGVLPRAQLDALDAALAERTPAGPVAPLTVAAGLLTLLTHLATEAPVLVAIDDLQWLDPASAAAVHYAARRVSRPVGFLWATRPHKGPPVAVPGAVEHHLGPLDEAAIDTLLRGRGLGQLPRERVAALAAGNPLYALELASAAGDDVAAIDEMTPTLRGALDAHLHDLGPSAREVLAIAGSTARPTVEVVRRAVGRPVDEDLAAAEDAGVVTVAEGVVGFTHPLLARAAADTLGPGARRRAHARLASVVASPEARARHLAHASLGPEREVLTALEEAAAAAAARGAPNAAADLLDLALALGPDAEGGDAARRLRAAGHHLAAGAVDEADALVTGALAAGAATEVEARALGLQGQVAMVRGHLGAAAEAFAAAVEATRDDATDDAREVRVWASQYLAFLLTNTDGLHRARPVADLALADADGLAPGLRAGAAATVVMVRALQGEPVDWDLLAEARRLEGAGVAAAIPVTSRPLLVEAILLHMVGRLRQAAEAFGTLYEELRAAGDEAALSVVDFWAQWVYCGLADFDAAATLADEAATRAAHLDNPRAEGTACTARATLASFRGDEQECREAAGRALDLIGHGAPPSAWALSALGLLELSLGDHRAAAATYRTLDEVASRVGGRSRRGAWWAADAIEASLGIGDVDQARELLALTEVAAADDDPAVGPDSRATAVRARALVRAAEGDLDDAEALLRQALDLHAQGDAPHAGARTQMALGGVLRRRGRRRDAAIALAAAAATFDGLAMRSWSDRCRREADRLGGRRAPSTLTPSEAQVAALVAEGRTNNEVAAALFISPKTVESNLTRVYRKLGVRRRTELGRALAATDGPEPTA